VKAGGNFTPIWTAKPHGGLRLALSIRNVWHLPIRDRQCGFRGRNGCELRCRRIMEFYLTRQQVADACRALIAAIANFLEGRLNV